MTSIDDLRKYLFGFAILVLVVFFAFEKWMKHDVSERIEKAQQGIASDEVAVAEMWKAYVETTDRALELMAEGDFLEGSKLLYHAFPDMEEAINRWGNTPLPGNQTLRDAHATLSDSLKSKIDAVYLQAKQSVIEGEFAPKDMKSFMLHTPFAYKNRLKNRWRRDFDEVVQQRVARASRWVMVSVGGSVANSELYENVIREVLVERWAAETPFQLVFGTPMDKRDAQASMRHINIYFDGESTSYEFSEGTGKRGSAAFVYSLNIRPELRHASDAVAKTSWDKLPPIKVEIEPEEKLLFEFDRHNQKQQADFDTAIKRQRKDLVSALAQALRQWPDFLLE